MKFLSFRGYSQLTEEQAAWWQDTSNKYKGNTEGRNAISSTLCYVEDCKEQQDLDWQQLIDHCKKKNSPTNNNLMYRTLAHRRYDVMSQELGIRNIKDRFFYGMCQIFLFFFCIVEFTFCCSRNTRPTSLDFVLYRGKFLLRIQMRWSYDVSLTI